MFSGRLSNREWSWSTLTPHVVGKYMLVETCIYQGLHTSFDFALKSSVVLQRHNPSCGAHIYVCLYMHISQSTCYCGISSPSIYTVALSLSGVGLAARRTPTGGIKHGVKVTPWVSRVQLIIMPHQRGSPMDTPHGGRGRNPKRWAGAWEPAGGLGQRPRVRNRDPRRPIYLS